MHHPRIVCGTLVLLALLLATGLVGVLVASENSSSDTRLIASVVAQGMANQLSLNIRSTLSPLVGLAAAVKMQTYAPIMSAAFAGLANVTLAKVCMGGGQGQPAYPLTP